ncbi:MAG: response regulator [Candidatus Omnitrophica bacterium]|nr:response regulator [Candidatus Omnitrophota bacterium]
MPKKILAIDDDHTNLRLIESRLTKDGFEVFTATDGEEGLKAAVTNNPDLIILDVEMPSMNGYTFMLEKAKRESIKKIPVVVLTSHKENQPIFEFKGARGYLMKPINFDQLYEKIKKLLPE